MYLNDLSRTLVAEGELNYNPFPKYYQESFRKGLSLYETEAFSFFHQRIGNERVSLVTMTSFFWQVFTSSDVFLPGFKIA